MAWVGGDLTGSHTCRLAVHTIAAAEEEDNRDEKKDKRTERILILAPKNFVEPTFLLISVQAGACPLLPRAHRCRGPAE